MAAVRAVRGPDISTTSTTPATATATANPRAPPAKPARTLPGPETQPESRKPAAGKRKAGALVAEGEGEGRRKSARLMGRRG